MKFQSDLQTCMARYRELYKYPSKVGSQRTITEFTVKRNKQAPNAVSEDVEVISVFTDETDIESQK